MHLVLTQAAVEHGLKSYVYIKKDSTRKMFWEYLTCSPMYHQLHALVRFLRSYYRQKCREVWRNPAALKLEMAKYDPLITEMLRNMITG